MKISDLPAINLLAEQRKLFIEQIDKLNTYNSTYQVHSEYNPFQITYEGKKLDRSMYGVFQQQFTDIIKAKLKQVNADLVSYGIELI